MKKSLLCLLLLICGILIGTMASRYFYPPEDSVLDLPEEQSPAEIIPVPLQDSHLFSQSGDSLATIVWFGEYGDPLSHKLAAQLAKLGQESQIPFTLSFRHAPLLGSEQNLLYALGAEAAARQNKFWEYHNLLLSMDTEALPSIDRLIEELALDGPRFQEDMADQQLKAKIYRDMGLARSFGVTMPPAIFINGHPLSAPITMADLQAGLQNAHDESRILLNQGVPAGQIYETLLLRAAPAVKLSVLASRTNRQQVIPRSDFPNFGSNDPLLWIYYFTTFGGPFPQEGNRVLTTLLQKYPTQLKVIYLPYAKDQLPASQLAAACSYWALDQNRFNEVTTKLLTLPSTYSIEQLYSLKNSKGQSLCPAQEALEQYQELVGAAGQLKQTMDIAADPALVLNGIDIPVIRRTNFLDSLITQELSLAQSLMQNGLHNQDLLLAITRTPPSQY